MANQKTTLISIVVSLIVSIGWQFVPLSAQASRSSPNTSQQVPPRSEPTPPTFEYKVLVFPSRSASRKTLGYGGAIAYAPPNLEDEINKLAEDGYAVLSQTQSSPSGTDYAAGYYVTTSEIVVLLKRDKK